MTIESLPGSHSCPSAHPLMARSIMMLSTDGRQGEVVVAVRRDPMKVPVRRICIQTFFFLAQKPLCGALLSLMILPSPTHTAPPPAPPAAFSLSSLLSLSICPPAPTISPALRSVDAALSLWCCQHRTWIGTQLLSFSVLLTFEALFFFTSGASGSFISSVVSVVATAA